MEILETNQLATVWHTRKDSFNKKKKKKAKPVVVGGPTLSRTTFTSAVCSVLGEEGFVSSLTGEGEVDLAGDELSDPSSLDADLDLDLDLFKPGEADLDFDLLPFTLGDLDLVLPGGGERDFD